MSGLYGNDSALFATIKTLLEVLDPLRRILAPIERSTDILQVHLASERTQGVIETLEVLNPAELESQYLLFQNTAQARVKALLL